MLRLLQMEKQSAWSVWRCVGLCGWLVELGNAQLRDRCSGTEFIIGAIEFWRCDGSDGKRLCWQRETRWNRHTEADAAQRRWIRVRMEEEDTGKRVWVMWVWQRLPQ